MILTFTGPNGSGKTTIARRLIQERPNARMLLSYTTRDARPDDIPGEYTYIDEDTFAAMFGQDAFEWSTPLMRGKNYGTARATLDQAVAAPDTLWMAIIVPERITNFYDALRARGAVSHVRSVFIRSPGNDTLKRRLMENRHLTEEAAARDVARCQDWETQAQSLKIPFIYIDDTDDLEEKYRHVVAAIGAA